MCEIAVLDPEQTNIEIAQQIAGRFYEEQGDSLGVLAVHDNGEKYSFDTYKSTQPHWQTLYSFYKRNWDDAWRFVVHGRYGTSGKQNRASAHPIEVDCSLCDFDYVIHNGSVRKYQQSMGTLSACGHEFTTGVDTEVIPHEVGELPENVDTLKPSSYNISGNLNYLLFSEDGILVKAERKYQLTDDFRMTCSYRDFKNMGFDRGRNEWMIARPGEDIETKSHTTSTNVSIRGASGRNTRTASYYNDAAEPGNSTPANWNDGENNTRTSGAQDDDVVLSFKNHINNFDYLSAIKLAPGLIRLTDHDANQYGFVRRSENPRLYYYYAPDETPDEETLKEMEQYAKNNMSFRKKFFGGGADVDEQQTTFADIAEREAAEATARVVEDATDATDAELGEQARIAQGVERLF